MDPTLPVLLAWSPERPYTTRTTDWNCGCPLGYFAEIVPKDAELTTPLPNGVEGVRCRLITGDAAVLAEESYSWEDTLANLNAAILEGASAEDAAAGAAAAAATAAQAAAGGAPSLPWWLLLLAAGVVLLSGGERTTATWPAWLGTRRARTPRPTPKRTGHA